MDNLNEYLQPINSPITTAGAASGYDFMTGYQRNSVDLTKIRNFNFSAGTGGTLTLGGSGNGNGVLFVKNSSGSTIAQINNSGITVTGGNIEVYNSGGTLTFDSSGLVGNANIRGDIRIFSGDQAFTTTTYTDITGSSMSFVLTRTTDVMFFLGVQSAQEQTSGGSDMSGRVEYTFNVDENPYTQTLILIDTGLVNATGVKDNVFRKSYFVSVTQGLTAGTHTVKAQYRTQSNTNLTAHLYLASLQYLILGT